MAPSLYMGNMALVKTLVHLGLSDSGMWRHITLSRASLWSSATASSCSGVVSDKFCFLLFFIYLSLIFFVRLFPSLCVGSIIVALFIKRVKSYFEEVQEVPSSVYFRLIASLTSCFIQYTFLLELVDLFSMIDMQL
jgi:hypothetical protein